MYINLVYMRLQRDPMRLIVNRQTAQNLIVNLNFK